MSVGDKLDAYTYEALLSEALAMAPDTVDKRQGSIIYDTLAVSDVQLAQAYIQLKGYYLDSYALTAEGDYLDLRVAEAGISRYPATPAVKLGIFQDQGGLPAQVPMGSRFSTSSDSDPLVYQVTDLYQEEGQAVPGSYRLTCETVGTAGNDYVGDLLPITRISGLASARLSGLLIPARDVETDAALRERYLEAVNRPAFGGNVSHYRQWVMEIPGVGGVQVYPVWNGGGTVKCVIIGSDYSPASPVLLQEVQSILDPEQNEGEGLGLAPIGHVVTVSTPQTLQVDVDAQVKLEPAADLEALRQEAQALVRRYLLELRSHFGQSGQNNSYEIDVYRARIASALMELEGIENVPEVLLNGEHEDLVLIHSAQRQQIPVEGSVTLHAV